VPSPADLALIRRLWQRPDLWFVVASLLVTALWIDFSATQQYHGADSLVMSLISIYRWTPLFWEQNRLGMLIPLLATPFRHPLTNLLVQSGLTIFSGFAGFFLLGYYVGGRRRGMITGAIGSLLFILALRRWQQFDYLVYIHQYATSLSLSLLALMAVRRWRLPIFLQQAGNSSQRQIWRPVAAVALIWLALWVNPSLAFALVPLVLLRPFLLGDVAGEFDRAEVDREKVADASPQPFPAKANLPTSWAGRLIQSYAPGDYLMVAATGSGLLLSMAVSRFCSTFQEPYGFLSPGEWFECATNLIKNLPLALDWRWLNAIALLALAGLIPLAWPAGRRALPGSLRLALGLLLPALVQFAFISSIDHVHRTDYSRYAFASIFLWQGAFILFAVVQWTAVLPDRKLLRLAPFALVTLVCVAAALRHGRPGIDVVRASLAETAGKHTAEILAERCSHVTGDYYNVWPAVFHANLTLADQGSPETVWAIAQRASITADRWTRVPLAETRIAEIIGDEQFSRPTLTMYGIEPFVVSRESTTIRVLCPMLPLAETPLGRSFR
jgi:hypothetical protein